jgi:hypothetical protein
MTMPKTRHLRKQKKPRPNAPSQPAESRANEAVTIAWTSSVTGVLVADLIVIAAHLYGRSNPDAQAAKALEAIMLLSAAVMGAISLALLVVVWRSRIVKPPRGYMVFAALVTAAPIIALAGRLWS